MAETIRKAAPQDVPRIVDLWRQMWAEHAAADRRFEAGPMAEIVMPRAVEEHLAAETSHVLVAESAGRIAGFAVAMILENPPLTVHQRYGYISELMVDPAQRRGGIGRRLVATMHAWFRSRGMAHAEIRVPARVRESGAFWRSQGYSEFVEQLRVEL